VFAFTDVSDDKNKLVEVTIQLKQLDVCAGTLCTHDADSTLEILRS
jgi:hypothetical protein